MCIYKVYSIFNFKNINNKKQNHTVQNNIIYAAHLFSNGWSVGSTPNFFTLSKFSFLNG